MATGSGIGASLPHDEHRPARRTASELLREASRDSASLDAPPFRAAPHTLEAEQALLGAILVNNEAHDRVSGFLEPHHFFDPLHQQIDETAAKLIATGKQVTPITLKTFFENAEPIGSGLSVPAYLGQLAVNATTIINVRDYGRTIYDLSIRRQLINVGEDMVNAAYDSPVDFPPKEQIEEAETRLFSLAETGKYGQGFSTFHQRASRRPSRWPTTPTSATAACPASPPGSRRSTASSAACSPRTCSSLPAAPPWASRRWPPTSPSTSPRRACARCRRSRISDPTIPRTTALVVGLFSLEMSAEQLATRILSEQAEIPSEKIRRGLIDEAEFKRLVKASEDMATLPLFIDQTGGLSVAQLAARARKLKRQQNLGLIIVDYLQLLTGSIKRASEGRVQEVSEITTSLKALAKELNVPVVALSQLSRAVENREDKRPQLADLRESGSIEQDADVVMFVYREEYYVERTKPQEGTPEFAVWMDKMQKASGKAELIVGKQRHGPTGTIDLQFDGRYTRFSDLAQDAYIPARTH